jgi:thiol-disulfide isomerase/thioredoxin
VRRLPVPLTVVLAAVLAAVLTLFVAGCTSPDERLARQVDVDTPALRAIKADAGIEQCPAPGAGRVTQAPDVVLPCLGGGPEVALRSVTGPAVLNVWAQWCGPCRAELPLFQRLHRRAAHRLEVLGIDWQDTQPASALELARASGVTYPLVADPGALVSDAWRVNGLPVTVFVDARGRTTVHRGRVASWRQLTTLVADHTGVRVSAG